MMEFHPLTIQEIVALPEPQRMSYLTSTQKEVKTFDKAGTRLANINAVIADLELKHQMLSAEMKHKLFNGHIPELAIYSYWLFLLNLRDLIFQEGQQKTQDREYRLFVGGHHQ